MSRPNQSAREGRMRKLYDAIMSPVNNERGLTLILSLILLLLLTIIGVTAINTSTTETLISSIEEVNRSTFNAAESGIEHATAILQAEFVANNQLAMQNCAATGGSACLPKWTFALNGSVFPTTASEDIPSPGSQWITRFNSGVPVVSNVALGNGYTYSVNVWNNYEPVPASPTGQTDNDGLIVVGALATGPNNAVAAAESVICGSITNVAPASAGYTAQAGAGAGKNYNASDVNAISAASLGGLSGNANLL